MGRGLGDDVEESVLDGPGAVMLCLAVVRSGEKAWLVPLY